MKKIICVLITLSMLLCGLAMAEGKTVKPMDVLDTAALTDGTYAASFEPADLADGALKLTVYTEDIYDIVDINTLKVGDTIYIGGEACAVESLSREGEPLLINGGANEGGYDLFPFDEDNCWKVQLDDDYATWTAQGEATLPLAGDATFTDGWDIEKEPVTVSGAEAVAEAINGTEMDAFVCLNTTVRVEGGRIVEIVRSYMP